MEEVEINGVRFEKQYWDAVQRQIARLTSAGLNVSGPDEYPAEHELFFSISKPKTTPGNTIPSKEVWYGLAQEDDRDTDAPSLRLTTDNGRWIVSHSAHIPGPGPGDFSHTYDRLEEAVGDVLDFYFGDSARMKVIWDSKRLG
jgi:hypothetical protein